MQASEVVVEPVENHMVLLGGDLQESLTDLARRLVLATQLGNDNELKLSIIFGYLYNMIAVQQANAVMMFTHMTAMATQIGYTELPPQLPEIEGSGVVDESFRLAIESALQHAVQLRSK